MWFKGIIIETKENYSIVMREDSSIIRVKNKENMKIGDSKVFLAEDIYIKEQSKNIKNKTIISLLSIAAVLSLFILPILQGGLSKSYALVSLDINPSIEFELDKNKKITNIYALNLDGENLKLESVKGLTLDEGVKKIKEDLNINKYKLKNDSAIVGFTFLTDKEDNEYEEDVKKIISNEFKGTKTVFLKSTKKESEIAKNEGVSVGRHEAKLSINEDVMENQIESMSVEEILELLGDKKNIYLNENQIEELHDELEDKIEDKNEKYELDSESEDKEDNLYEQDNYEDDNNNDDKEDDDYNDDKEDDDDNDNYNDEDDENDENDD